MDQSLQDELDKLPEIEIRRDERADVGARRCRSLGCANVPMPINGFCQKHQQKAQEKPTNRYRIAAFQERANQLSNANNFMSSRDEITCLRLSLDAIMSMCLKDFDLISYGPRIKDMTESINKALANAQKLEKATGNVLDKQALISLVDTISIRISDIIKKHITDTDKSTTILNEINDSLGEEIERTIETATTEATNGLDS